MLVKINNNDEFFASQINKLKRRFDVGTGSGAATQAVLSFMELEEKFNSLEVELELVRGNYESLSGYIKQKDSLDKIIHKLTN